MDDQENMEKITKTQVTLITTEITLLPCWPKNYLDHNIFVSCTLGPINIAVPFGINFKVNWDKQKWSMKLWNKLRASVQKTVQDVMEEAYAETRSLEKVS